MLERSLYDACLCADFGGGGYAGTGTLVTDEVYETNIGSGTGWVATTIDCGFNSNENVG